MPRSFLVRKGGGAARRQLSDLIVEELHDGQYVDHLNSCWQTIESTTTAPEHHPADDAVPTVEVDPRADRVRHRFTFTQLSDGENEITCELKLFWYSEFELPDRNSNTSLRFLEMLEEIVCEKYLPRSSRQFSKVDMSSMMVAQIFTKTSSTMRNCCF